MTNSKPLSSCCMKPAKVNMAPSEGSTRYHFCTHCGDPCDLSERKVPFKKSTLSATRKPSGEMEVFKELYVECKGVSVISGQPLYPPGHSMFHHQFAHVLPKGSHPELRLVKRNIFPVTVDEHRYQTEHPGRCERDPLWAMFWKVRDELKERVNGV